MSDFEVHPVGTGERLKSGSPRPDQPTGASMAAEGHMPFAGHRSQAEVRAEEKGGAIPAVMAVFRPRARVVVVFVAGGDPTGVQLEVAEARAVHMALGQALKLADSVDAPVAAVVGVSA